MDSPEEDQPATPPSQMPPLPEDDSQDDDNDEEAEEDPQNTTTPSAGDYVKAVDGLELLEGYRNLGKEAVCWSLSSAKPGNGVDQIRDGKLDTYWQSDGSQPHFIRIYFARRVAVSHVCLFLDYNMDESYTPKRVTVQTGMTQQDLTTCLEVDSTSPWDGVCCPFEPRSIRFRMK